MRVASIALCIAGCAALAREQTVEPSRPTDLSAPTSLAGALSAPTSLPPIPEHFCVQNDYPFGSMRAPPVDLEGARGRAREFVQVMSQSTGVFLPPSEPSGAWDFGVLALDPIGDRAVELGTWDFAFPYECPRRTDVARVVRVTPHGALLLYPPVSMPSWHLLRVAPVRYEGPIEHPELVGLWRGTTCVVSTFSYDGREIVSRVDTMRDWEFRTEDGLRRAPARWRGPVLQWFIGVWEDYAELLADGTFVIRLYDETCVLAPATGDACDLSAWSRPRPVVPRELPSIVPPGMIVCDHPRDCDTDEWLVGYVCASHRATP